uniref:Uncharacterized protein n=1 Tax=Arundo donax TaxID=35708 RepID=A0A0A9AV49_ARUDO
MCMTHSQKYHFQFPFLASIFCTGHFQIETLQQEVICRLFHAKLSWTLACISRGIFYSNQRSQLIFAKLFSLLL